MAEFVEKRCEDMSLELQQLERIKLFDKKELKGIIKKRKEHEYKIERHTKCKEDYLRYIQYEMDLLKLVKQRRDKFGITQKKSDIDYSIANRVNRLYKQAIFRFQDDVRFWIAYMKFCKNVRFQNCLSRMLGRMLQVHQDKPKCWHIAARWEMEETKDLHNAKQLLLRGLHLHPNSQLLFLDIFKLELDSASSKHKSDKKNPESANLPTKSDKVSMNLKRAEAIYEQAFKRVKNIKFIFELLDVLKNYENTKALESRIITDMVKEYVDEPLMWDLMARRELQGMSNSPNSDIAMEVDGTEQNSLRDRIISCNEVYQTAVKRLKSVEMWSLYIDCMLKINLEGGSLMNLKRKLLKAALFQGHQAKKLKEEHYLDWIGMLDSDKNDENSRMEKSAQVFYWATEALPDSEKLWYSRLSYLITNDDEDSAAEILMQATELLGEKSLSLWKLKHLNVQAKTPEKVKEFFQSALLGPQNVANHMKPAYLVWTALTENVEAARKIYESISLQPPFCVELHKKILEIEIMQPVISLKYARRSLEMAIIQFGKNNVAIWMDYITFEMNYGDPRRAGDIYTRAVKMLDALLADQFIAEYSLLKANTPTK